MRTSSSTATIGAGVHVALDRPLPWGWVDVPMLFRPSMVERLLAGAKTETRRLRGLERFNKKPDCVDLVSLEDRPKKGVVATFQSKFSCRHYEAKCPYGRPGDRIWVREKWYHEKGRDFENAAFDDGTMKMKGDRATGDTEKVYSYGKLAWAPTDRKVWRPRPSIHMPRWAARILLRITEIRVERLYKITEAGAIAEGVRKYDMGVSTLYGLTDDLASGLRPSAKDYFLHVLWDGIHAEDGLGCAANPWVWVVKFKRVEDDGIPRTKGK